MLDNSQTYIGVVATFYCFMYLMIVKTIKEKITVKVILYYLFFLKCEKNYLY